MPFSYDPDVGYLVTTCRITNTIVPLVLRRLEFWLLFLLHLLAYLAYRHGYLAAESEEESIFSVSWHQIDIIKSVTTFFEVFYTNQCFSRYNQLYDKSRKMLGNLQDFALEVRLFLRPSCPGHARLACRYFAASVLLLFQEAAHSQSEPVPSPVPGAGAVTAIAAAPDLPNQREEEEPLPPETRPPEPESLPAAPWVSWVRPLSSPQEKQEAGSGSAAAEAERLLVRSPLGPEERLEALGMARLLEKESLGKGGQGERQRQQVPKASKNQGQGRGRGPGGQGPREEGQGQGQGQGQGPEEEAVEAGPRTGPGAEDWEALLRGELLDPEEEAVLQSYQHHQRPAILLHWSAEVCRDGCQEAKLAAVTQKSLVEKLLLSRLMGQEVLDTMEMPIPFQYFHLLNLMVLINLLLWAYCMAQTSSLFGPVTFFFASMIFMGMLELAVALSDPFGSDDVDFPLADWLREFLGNARVLVNLESPASVSVEARLHADGDQPLPFGRHRLNDFVSGNLSNSATPSASTPHPRSFQRRSQVQRHEEDSEETVDDDDSD